MCVSNWNAHTIISPPRTVSSTHMVVSWISIFSIPINRKSLWEVRQVQAFAMSNDEKDEDEEDEKEEEQQVGFGQSAAQ